MGMALSWIGKGLQKKIGKGNEIKKILWHGVGMEKSWNGMEYEKLMALTWNEKGLQQIRKRNESTKKNGIELGWNNFLM